jgi:hypothetical protein
MPKQEAPKPEAETPKKPQPRIDHQFWFDLSKDMVEQSPSKLDEAAAKVQTTVAWLWGVYTAGATVGIALSKLSYPLWVNILIAAPSVVLIFAYWKAAQAQMPILQKVDPRAPSKIEEAFSEIVASKHKRFNIALGLSLAAAVLVALALVAASFTHQAATPSFQAYLHTYEGRDNIALSGHFPADTDILVKIASPEEAGGVLKEVPYVASSTGELQTNIALDSSAAEYTVTIEWTEKDGMVRSLQRTVPPPK